MGPRPFRLSRLWGSLSEGAVERSETEGVTPSVTALCAVPPPSKREAMGATAIPPLLI